MREGKKEKVSETNSRSSISLNRIIFELNNSSCSEEVLVNDTPSQGGRSGREREGREKWGRGKKVKETME